MHFVAVGWDKRIRIWRDNRFEKQEEDAGNDVVRVPRNKDWPQIDPKASTKKECHNTDIMSLCYDPKTLILFTGGHDGYLLGWHFDTSSIKYYLHSKDPSCVITNSKGEVDHMMGVKTSKSVDCMEIMQT